jgi:3'-5' exoribonuclease
MKNSYSNVLLDFIDGIQTTSLKGFVKSVFAEEDVLEKFLIVPASYNHHHPEQGGLLRHSMEVVEIIGQHSFDSTSVRELAMVAGLLHDIGKIRTHDINGHMTALGLQVGHEYMTLEICAEALKKLDQSWSIGANLLRHCWTCGTFNSRIGYQPNSSIALIVKNADQLSVQRDYERQAFKASKPIKGMHFHSLGRFQKIKRPPMVF